MRERERSPVSVFGLCLIALAIAVPAPLFALAPSNDAAALFSQYLGAGSLIAMAIAQLLATRASWLEPVFGPLDRIYILHKWLGVGALAGAVAHDLIDADIRGLGPGTGLADLAETLGEISFYGLIALVILSIATFVPYALWRWTHRVIGAFFVLAAAHFAFILKPFPLSDPLGLYILAFCAIGTVSYVYTQLPPALFARRRAYRVSGVERTGGCLSVSLEPTAGRGIRHRPGQFAFVSFGAPAAGEAHPFTLSRAPDDTGALRVTLRALGDDTAALASQVTPGVAADVEGPFGRFERPARARREVWIAGGVGVTPFVAWAQALGAGSASTPVDMFYAVRSRDGAPHLAELEAIAAEQPHFRLHVIESSAGDRLSAARIQETVGAVASAHVAFCGPEALRESVRKGLIAAGLPARRFHFEAFEIRSGIGVRAALRWLRAWWGGAAALAGQPSAQPR